MTKSLAVFCPETPAGEELLAGIRVLAVDLSYAVKPFPATWKDYSRAVLCEDVVVVDLSYEDRERHLFKIISVLPSLFDHVLVVSRTYLPLNVVPCSRGGAPAYPGRLNNIDILRWLSTELTIRKDAPSGRRLTAEEFADLPTDTAAYLDMTRRVLAKRAGKQEEKQVFISFRGKHYDDVRNLKSQLVGGKIRGYEGYTIRVVEPREYALDRELLSEGMRWLILSLLDDDIRASDEVWIYETEDYLASWWTLGEVVAAAYVAAPPSEGPALKIFDPAALARGGGPTDDDGRYHVRLTEPQRKRLARIFANVRPDTMGPENKLSFKIQRFLFRVGLGGWYLRRLRALLENKDIGDAMFNSIPSEIASKDEITKEMIELASDQQAYRDYLNDRVYQDEFWEELCIERSVITGKRETFTVDAMTLIAAPLDRMLRVPRTEVERALRRGRPLTLKGMKEAVHVEEGEPRYIWKPVHAGGLFEGSVERLPTYLVKDAPAAMP